MTDPLDKLTPTDLVPSKEGKKNWLQQAEELEAARLAEINAKGLWPARLPFDLAMEMGPAELTFEKHGLTEEQALALMKNADFIATIKFWRDQVIKEGVSFKTKAKMMAEDLLETGYMLATNPATADTTRANMIQWFAKVAGHEPKKDSEGGGGQGSGFTLTLNFSGDAAPSKSAKIIDVEPSSD